MLKFQFSFKTNLNIKKACLKLVLDLSRYFQSNKIHQSPYRHPKCPLGMERALEIWIKLELIRRNGLSHLSHFMIKILKEVSHSTLETLWWRKSVTSYSYEYLTLAKGVIIKAALFLLRTWYVVSKTATLKFQIDHTVGEIKITWLENYSSSIWQIINFLEQIARYQWHLW